MIFISTDFCPVNYHDDEYSAICFVSCTCYSIVETHKFNNQASSSIILTLLTILVINRK